MFYARTLMSVCHLINVCSLFCFPKSVSFYTIETSQSALMEVVSDEKLWSELKKFLAADFCAEVGLFIDEYKKLNLETAKHEQLEPLFLKFIAKNAVFELNLTYESHHALCRAFSLKSLSCDLFLMVYKEVLESIFSNSFPRYLDAMNN